MRIKQYVGIIILCKSNKKMGRFMFDWQKIIYFIIKKRLLNVLIENEIKVEG